MSFAFRFTVLLVIATLPMSSAADSVSVLDPKVHDFISTYCLSCHGAEEAHGDQSFDGLSITRDGAQRIDLDDESNLETLTAILDQINLGDMPPKDNDVKQPTDAEVRHVVSWLTNTLIAVEASNDSDQTVLRRLNRNEYRNTMRDLLGMDSLSIDPTSSLPDDDAQEGFTNIGAVLNLSDEHLAAYLSAADQYLDMALHFGDKPEPKRIDIRPMEWGIYDPKDITPWMYSLPVGNKFFDIGSGKLPLSSLVYMITYPKKFANSGGVREPGYYKIQVSAEAIRRLTHPYDPRMIPTDLTAPMRMGLYVAHSSDGLAAGGVNSRLRLATWDLKDHEVQDFETTVWLAEGAVPFLHWENGPGSSDYWMKKVLEKYHTNLEFRGKQGELAWHIKPDNAVPGLKISDVWQGPLMRIHGFRFVGPLPRTFMSLAQQKYLGGAATLDDVDIKEALMKFARSAFRRPVSIADVTPYVDLAERAMNDLGRTKEDSLRIALKAILISPDFLFLREIADADDRLTAHELANRLSYFLWSSMPDDQLFALADSGRLLNPVVLSRQVDRMIDDEKSEAFINGFCNSWLRLDKLGSMPPDEHKFFEFYRDDLETAMRQETIQFVSHILRENLSISDFLASQYTFLNESLAKHYGIEGVVGNHFRKVTLPLNGQRGGLLGHASILTLTANGVDTTPVVRGVWILESILGTPPSSPPPDVEPLDPDVRGTTTIRERLAKHREVETCRSCHAKIDPFGFPLEFYDPIGGFRPQYYRKVVMWKDDKLSSQKILTAGIDGSATLPSGEQVSVPFELKRALLDHKEQFSRSLAEKLLTYACGREMTLSDNAEIDRISSDIAARGYRFRDLIHSILASDTFQRR